MRKLTRATPDVNRTNSCLAKTFLLVLDSAHSVHKDDDEEEHENQGELDGADFRSRSMRSCVWLTSTTSPE
jgi:hypothetical protein